MTYTIPFTKNNEAIVSLVNLVEKGKNKFKEYIVTINGKPRMVVMSMDEYESMKETMEIMADPGLMAAIREGEKEIAEGKGIPWEEVKKELEMDDDMPSSSSAGISA